MAPIGGRDTKRAAAFIGARSGRSREVAAETEAARAELPLLQLAGAYVEEPGGQR